MQTIETLRAAWEALRIHDEAIMARRPDGYPRGDWRSANPPTFDTTFRVKFNGKEASLIISSDPAPVARVWSTGAAASLLKTVNLNDADGLDSIEWPAPNDMINREFSAIRRRLGLTQAHLATVLDYSAAINVSAMERETSPRAIPKHIARLMRAYDAGYRPADWPK